MMFWAYRRCRDVKWFFYDLIRGMKNLYDYAPLIYRDRDWDHIYLAELLEFKLARMEKCLRNGHLLHANKRADSVEICRILAGRLANEHESYYQKEYFVHEGKSSFYSYRDRSKWDAQYLGKMLGKHLLTWWD